MTLSRLLYCVSYLRIQKLLFGFFSLCFAFAAAHHVYEYVDPRLRPDYPPIRHQVFVAINIGMAVLMVRRSKWFVPILFMLVVQQVSAHGQSLLHSRSVASPMLCIDWVIVFFAPILFAAYCYDVFRHPCKQS